MKDSQKITQFFDSLLKAIDDIKEGVEISVECDIILISKLDILRGKIEGVKMGLEWTQESNKEKK